MPGASLVPRKRDHVHFITRRLPVEVANALARSGHWLSKSLSEPDHSLSIYGIETTQNWPCKRSICPVVVTLNLVLFESFLITKHCGLIYNLDRITILFCVTMNAKIFVRNVRGQCQHEGPVPREQKQHTWLQGTIEATNEGHQSNLLQKYV